MTRLPKGRALVLASLAGLAALAIAAPIAGAFWSFVGSLAVVYALLALGLVVLTGWSGQLNLHVAALGLGWGAYAAFSLTALGLPVFWAVLASGLLAAPFAVAVGLGVVRFRGLELAVATLALGLVSERLIFRNIARMLGPGDTASPFETSFVTVDRPSLGVLSLEGEAAFFVFALLVAAVCFLAVGNLGRSATGRALRAIREREVLAETLGVPVIRYRVGAFALSILLAATAGGLFASLSLGINPESFTLDRSFQVLAAAVIGGIASPAGAAIAGALGALLPEAVRFGPLQIFGGERLFLLFGAGMVLVLWRMPGGIAGALARGRSPGAFAGPPALAPAAPALAPPALAPSVPQEPAPVLAPSVPQEPAPALALAARKRPAAGPAARRLARAARPTALRVEGVRVCFGGVVALDGVSLAVAEGEICALIGPNGAGKSTLFNSICGLVDSEAGRVYLGGRDVTELAPHRRAALGLGRTFQAPEVFRGLSVIENVMVAAHGRRRAGPAAEAAGLPAARRSEESLRRYAHEVLAALGLDGAAGSEPAALPLGTLRVLQLAMALASGPRVLLLDEPSAGLDARETAALADLVARLRDERSLSVLVVEHDMSFVARVAEHVTVLDFGEVIAAGSAAEVRADPLVIDRYLGHAEAAILPGTQEAAVVSAGAREGDRRG